MNKYHVTFFEMSSGSEGIPSTHDYGFVDANSEDEAKNIIANKEYPIDIMYGPDKAWSTRDFLKSCLQAKIINS